MQLIIQCRPPKQAELVCMDLGFSEQARSLPSYLICNGRTKVLFSKVHSNWQSIDLLPGMIAT